MERSKSLTRGSGWPIFGAWLLVFVASMGLGFLGFFFAHGYDPDQIAQSPWVDLTIALLLSPFSATMAAVAYFMLRHGKENVDVKAIAAVFD